MLIEITDPTHAGEARRHAARYAEDAKLGEKEGGGLALVVTEMVTNVVKHAGNGTLLVEAIKENGDSGVRVLAMDKGPGIRDISGAMRDGYSTAGTPGNGLGAMKRLSHAFDICTAPGIGTAVLSEFWSKKTVPNGASIEVGVISVPIKGEEVSGDGWGTRKHADSLLLMVVDGLGHGILAAEAAREAERVFGESRSDSPTPILQDSHNSLKKTRGAAMAVASLHLEKRLISYAGIGNIGSSIVNPNGNGRGMASHNGTLGHHLARIQEFSFPDRKSVV